jgi:hypothetical protein
MGEMRNVYKIVVRKPEVERPMARLKCKWGDNIRMDHKEIECMWKLSLEGLKEIGCDYVGCIHLAQVRVQWWAVVSMVMNFEVP